MSTDFQPTDELIELLANLTDSFLLPEQQTRLNQLITEDPQVRDFYIDYIRVHAILIWSHGSVPTLEVPMDAPAELLPRRKKNLKSWAFSIAVGLSVLLAAFAGLYYATIGRQPAAITMHDNDTEWGEDESPLRDGQLKVGGGNLTAGFFQLKLPTGVIIAMQGPVTFYWPGGNEFNLDQGRVKVYVPPNATGFTLNAPRIKIVDMGTEFGVAVHKGGDVEVHVFQGELMVNNIPIYKDEAKYISMKEERVVDSKINERAFPAFRP